MSNTISITNSRGTVVATIAPGTFDTTTPVSMAGRGSNGFALTNNNNFYRLTENFANSTAPTSPIEGMTWYDTTTGLKVRTSTNWVALATGANSDIILPRLGTASNVSLAATGSTNIHTGATGVKTFVTGLLLVPKSGATVTGPPPAIALEVTNSTGDVADRIVLKGLDAASKFFRYSISGSQRIVQAGETVKMNVKTAVTGGDVLNVDVYLYGVTL